MVALTARGPGARGAQATGAGRAPSLALATILFVLFLTFLDNTIVTVVLAHVQSDLHASVNQLQWVVNGYALTFATLMLSFGTLGDLMGRKRVMLAGVVVFGAGSVICALAPTTDVLIAGRVVMGVGAAASEPGTLSMIRQLFAERRARAQALGLWAAVSSMGLALGPLIGGLLAGYWSWRGIFWFNLFFGTLAFVSAAVVLPESADPVNARLDVYGLFLGALTLGAATFATIVGETEGYGTWWIALLYATAAVGAAAFVAVELRATSPVLDVRYFARPAFAGSNVVATFAYFGTFALFFLVALYLQLVGSASALKTALDFVPMAVGMVAASVLTGRWVAAWGPRLPMAAGCVLAGAGLLLTEVYLTSTSGLSSVGWTMLLAGVGIGVAMVPVTSAALGSTPARHSGMAASMTNTSRELGAVAGVAVLGSLMNGQLTVNLAHRLSQIGVPGQYQSLVITAVETGNYQSGATQAEKNPAIARIVHEVLGATYHAVGQGIDIALSIGGALLLVAAVIALISVYGKRAHLRLFGPGHHLLLTGEADGDPEAARA